MNKTKLLLYSCAVFAFLTPGVVQARVLRFDEAFAIADGFTYGGVTFNYTFGGSSSPQATFGIATNFYDTVIQNYVLLGGASDADDPSRFGVITFSLDQLSAVLNFGVLLNTTADAFLSLQLYDELLSPLAPITIAATYDHVNCDPVAETCFAEALFNYAGSVSISKAALSFSGSNSDYFFIDNLETSETPEPGTLSLFLLAGVGLAAARSMRNRWRFSKASAIASL